MSALSLEPVQVKKMVGSWNVCGWPGCHRSGRVKATIIGYPVNGPPISDKASALLCRKHSAEVGGIWESATSVKEKAP
jgi:hypothetical protein